ncbi:hypothetical protein [Streptomyces sp. YGL11-2]|uniref:hypothetical protein n=1 Tax=Streptomyces sp. YGL11-2 TaxID=3414028 RepID=UPI003CF7C3AE
MGDQFGSRQHSADHPVVHAAEGCDRHGGDITFMDRRGDGVGADQLDLSVGADQLDLCPSARMECDQFNALVASTRGRIGFQ